MGLLSRLNRSVKVIILKNLVSFVVLAVLVVLVGITITLMPVKLSVPSEPPVATSKTANPPGSMRMSTVVSGYMESQQLFTFRGGKPGKSYISGMAAMLIQHPNGDVLIDTGFGRDVDEQFLTTPPLMQKLASVEKEVPVADQFKANQYALSNLRGIFLTHSHWDHVSGASDLAPTPVLIPAAGKEFINSGNEAVVLAKSMTGLVFQTYEFNDGPYELYERSYDVYTDGSLVIVPMGGHTPGSVGVFVNLPSGKRYFLVGDIVWAKEGYQLPAERPWLSRRLVDLDPAAVREQVVKLHQLSKLRPELTIVPAHDRRVHETLAVYPKFEN